MSENFCISDTFGILTVSQGTTANLLVSEVYSDTKPVRHKKYGLGWRVDSLNATYFLNRPDILQQEILAIEQKAKLRKQKQKHKGQKHDNKE